MIYQTKVDKLTINNAKGDYRSYVYVAPSEQDGTTGLGQLFIIVEIKSREKKIPAVLNQIVEELSEYYYHSPTKNTEAALETTCQYFNENIMDITGKNLKWIKDKVNILVAAIQGDKLILSNYNNIKVWMFRDNKIHSITSGQAENKTSGSGKKILSQLISGQLANDDVLLLTNSTIFDYFSDEKIKKTISTLAPTQACAFFKNTLIDYKVSIDFSTIIIKFSSFKKEQKEIIDTTTKQDVLQVDEEIEQLNKAQPGISTKIMVTAGSKLKNIFSQTGDKLSGAIKSKIKPKDKTDEAQMDVLKAKPEISQDSQLALPSDQEMTKKQLWLLKFKKWKGINIVEYRLVLLILIVGILFISSLLLVSNKKEEQQKSQEFQQLVENINEKINSMEAALIYKDENRAQELLAEAKDLLNNLPKLNAEQQYTYQQLSALIEEQVNRIYKLDKISNPTVMALLADDFKPTSNLYLGTGNIIYVARGGEIYKLNSDQQALDKVADIQAQIKKILSFDKNKVLLLTNQDEIWLMDTSNYSTRKISFSLPDSQSLLKDVATYAQKLYILDEGNNNIYKYTYNTTSFSNPQSWLKEDEDDDDVTGNISLAVDGNVWLSARDAKISKFFKGKKEVFNLRGAYDPISQNVVLLTSDSLTNLYLLDKEKNRIFIADKQGKIIKQLLSDDLKEIKSILPSGNEEELYILAEDGIYKIEI